MRGRVAVFLSLLVISPALSQQTNVTQRINQRYAAHEQNVRPESAPEIDQRANRLREINHDIEELSALSTSLQSDLQELQKGLLVKDLNQKLKKMEKLSKRLRQEVAQ
jgi:predicted transcriptional regulator